MVESVEKNRIEKIHLYILSEEDEMKEVDGKDKKEQQGKDEPAGAESQAS